MAENRYPVNTHTSSQGGSSTYLLNLTSPNNDDKTFGSKHTSDRFLKPTPPLPRATTFGSLKTAGENASEYWARYILLSGKYPSRESSDSEQEINKTFFSRYSGWRGGVLIASCATFTVLLLNIAFAIFGLVVSKSGMKVGTLMNGDCGRIGSIDTWLHIIINIAGTCLQAASNFTMQCIGSPTRTEIDSAHARGKYRDIGLQSLRNLTGIRKKLLYGLLVLSSLPLHFFWNSAVLTKTQSLDYNVFVVKPWIFSTSSVDCSASISKVYDKTISSGWEGDIYQNFSLFGIGSLGSRTHLQIEADGRIFNSTRNTTVAPTGWYQDRLCDESNGMLQKAKESQLIRLNNDECINTYGVPASKFSTWGSVILVTKPDPPPNIFVANQTNHTITAEQINPALNASQFNRTLIESQTNLSMLLHFRYQTYVSKYTGNNWVCGPAHLLNNSYVCDYRNVSADAGNWTIGAMNANPAAKFGILRSKEWPIDYCLAERTGLGGECQLQYSSVVMICVIVSNTVILICMVTLLSTQDEPLLATIGDGIASFLQDPDKFTEKIPFLTRNEAKEFHKFQERMSSQGVALKNTPRRWRSPKIAHRWWRAPSCTRLSITLLLCVSAIIMTIGLLYDAYERSAVNASMDEISPWAMGFGSYNSYSTLPGWGGDGSQGAAIDFTSTGILMQLVAMANLPQVIVSCLYFAYNAMYTSMVSADEWSRFTSHRKALRTTMPRGQQRSTYWLSLPWTYALPVATASAILHYLVSQSLFITRTEILNTNGEPEPISFMQLAYSPLAWLLATLFGLMMVLCLIVNGFRRLKPCVLVANNSLAIAAACHNIEGDEGAELRKVSWGAVVQARGRNLGHCTFTSKEVEGPREGKWYI
ncbi:hypothetical protein HYFRA_00007890 [Hymenoscyphus fraxineus]|uniref:DUF6536 domain-containing protein n=1 Tax=Hymenoscyphus fraxineus TaxID=746836 RepID=A0A9N9PKA6_9HELO|nr:hypothetical protein HYFRA_00007890 [Hymenoscyphus fraxineus]